MSFFSHYSLVIFSFKNFGAGVYMARNNGRQSSAIFALCVDIVSYAYTVIYGISKSFNFAEAFFQFSSTN